METLSLARLADIAREDIREVKRVDTSKKGIKSLDDLRYGRPLMITQHID